jgi:hypothetical protein
MEFGALLDMQDSHPLNNQIKVSYLHLTANHSLTKQIPHDDLHLQKEQKACGIYLSSM